MLLIAAAMAQDTLVLPPVPVVGIDPVVQWLMGIASVMLPGLFSVLLIFLKQKFNADRVDADSDKIIAAAQRGAALGRRTGTTLQNAVTIGVDYVKAGVPDAIAATPQATDAHLANLITASLPPFVAVVPRPEGPPR